jgi:A/G-specific adenine glycosylase
MVGRQDRWGRSYDTSLMRRETRPPPSPSELRRAARIGRALEGWFAGSGRDFPWRLWRDDYRIAITEVLLQRTRAEAVRRFIGPFLHRFPTAGSLAASSARELEEALAPIGLQRRRAASLKKLAETMVRDEDLSWEQRPGVGQYVARAIAVGVSNDRLAMVDSNFVRLLHRAFLGDWMSDYRYDKRLQALALAVVSGDPRTVNWAVLDLGALVCLPRVPRCSACPIRDQCLTGLLRD